jgi:RND family efflux transporter MFP subunit
VIVPGRAQVDHVITATGMIAARREMPVGSVGEGGQVVRVLVEPGQWVRQGQVLATIDRQVQVPQLEQLSAQIRVAEADARLAQSELDRANALVSRGFISTADVERKTATRDSANARVRVARAQLTEARARVSRLDIRAPDAGLILTRQVEPGQVVGAGSGVLFRMARGGEMELLANVSETEIPNISAGARADVTPVGSTQGFTGQVWQVSPIINAETRQGVARIALSYAPGLRPGGFAEARIVSGSGQATLLPESAVLNDQKGSYVYVVGADNKVQRVDVTVGQVSDAGVSVTGGISGNERIVLSAGGFLNPGDAVRPVTQRRQ